MTAPGHDPKLLMASPGIGFGSSAADLPSSGVANTLPLNATQQSLALVRGTASGVLKSDGARKIRG